MSPKALPDDELSEEPEAPPAPKRAAKAIPTAAVTEISLPEETLRAGMPVVRCRVVYLGPGEHHAVSFTGQIHEEVIEDPDGPVTRRFRGDPEGQERQATVIKKAVDTGITQYDFTVRDTLGRLMPERMMPGDTEPSKLRGRPFCWCEHLGHLRRFFLAEDASKQRLYDIRVRPEDVPLLRDHIRRSERARRQQEALFADVAGT